MGNLKQEIVYLGDVVNTTARIIDQCKIRKKYFLISELLLKLLDADKYKLSNLGEIELKGKEQLLTIFSIEGQKKLNYEP